MKGIYITAWDFEATIFTCSLYILKHGATEGAHLDYFPVKEKGMNSILVHAFSYNLRLGCVFSCSIYVIWWKSLLSWCKVSRLGCVFRCSIYIIWWKSLLCWCNVYHNTSLGSHDLVSNNVWLEDWPTKGLAWPEAAPKSYLKLPEGQDMDQWCWPGCDFQPRRRQLKK